MIGKIVLVLAVASMVSCLRVSHEGSNDLSGYSYKVGPLIAKATDNTIGPIKFTDSAFSFKGCNRFTCPYTLSDESFKVSDCQKTTDKSCSNDKDSIILEQLKNAVTVKRDGNSFRFLG
jgi:heat shock protein HslJ